MILPSTSKASKPSPIPGVSNQGTYTELFYLNHNESVVGTTDDPLLNQPLKTKNGYYPYGTIEYSEGTSYNPLKFAGNYYEPTPNSYESPPVDQMYSMGTRMYDPTTCRFLTGDIWGPDILTDPWTIHSYHYCKNDPVNRIDPWGLVSTETWCNQLVDQLESEMQAMIEEGREIGKLDRDFNASLLVCGTTLIASVLMPGIKTISAAVKYIMEGVLVGVNFLSWGCGNLVTYSKERNKQIEKMVEHCKKYLAYFLK